MTVQPIADLPRRMPEAGRIRLGEKGPRGEPRALRTLRFTSDNEAAIREIAALYGGEVKPWNPRGQRHEFQVTTTVSEVPVVLPPDPLGGTPIYELWSAGGIVRRCDGDVCAVARNTPDGAEQIDVPCICAAQESLECVPTTRLSVLLPDIHFAGTWRLESKGWYAAKELPGMVEAITTLQARGFTKAILALSPRSRVIDGRTHNFVVPVLRVDHTISDIMDGAASLRAIASPEAAQPSRLALPGPPLLDATVDLDDEVAEAEVVEEPPEPSGSAPWRRVAILCRECGLDDVDRHAIAYTVSDGRTSSTKELTDDETRRVLRMLSRLQRGEVTYRGITDGRAVFTRAQEGAS